MNPKNEKKKKSKGTENRLNPGDKMERQA